MDFDVVRQYLVDSGIVPKCTNKKDHRKKYDAIFLLDKPEEIEADTFLVYRYRLDEGGIVKKYRLEIDIFAKDILLAKALLMLKSSSVSPGKPTIISVVRTISGILQRTFLTISRYCSLCPHAVNNRWKSPQHCCLQPEFHLP